MHLTFINAELFTLNFLTCIYRTQVSKTICFNKLFLFAFLSEKKNVDGMSL